MPGALQGMRYGERGYGVGNVAADGCSVSRVDGTLIPLPSARTSHLHSDPEGRWQVAGGKGALATATTGHTPAQHGAPEVRGKCPPRH